jgi:hypothetical protein
MNIETLDSFRRSIWSRFEKPPVLDQDQNHIEERYLDAVNALPIWDIDEVLLRSSEVQTGLVMLNHKVLAFYLPGIVQVAKDNEDAMQFLEDLISIKKAALEDDLSKDEWRYLNCVLGKNASKANDDKLFGN